MERQFGIVLSRSAVGWAMHALVLTPQRPLYRAAQRDAVPVERWQSEEFPAIADEVGMRSDHSLSPAP